MQTGVYCIRNTVNNKRYVGSAGKSFKHRWDRHKDALRNGRHHSRHLQAAWVKYGSKAFRFEIIQRCLPEECVACEQYWMNLYSSVDGRYGYNIAPKAGSTLGLKMTPEQREKCRLAHVGKKLTEEHKRKIGVKSKGRKLSDEVKAKIGAGNRGKKRSLKFRRHLSIACRGWNHSEESKKKIGDRFRGIKLSEEHRRKIKRTKKRLAKKPERRAAILAAARIAWEKNKKPVVTVKRKCVRCGKRFQFSGSPCVANRVRNHCSRACRNVSMAIARKGKCTGAAWYASRGLTPP